MPAPYTFRRRLAGRWSAPTTARWPKSTVGCSGRPASSCGRGAGTRRRRGDSSGETDAGDALLATIEAQLRPYRRIGHDLSGGRRITRLSGWR